MTVMNNSWPSGRGMGRRKGGWWWRICIVLDALAFIKITRVLMFLLVEKSIRAFLNNRAVLPCAHKMAGRKEKSLPPSFFPSSKALKGDINRGTRREPLIKYM